MTDFDISAWVVTLCRGYDWHPETFDVYRGPSVADASRVFQTAVMVLYKHFDGDHVERPPLAVRFWAANEAGYPIIHHSILKFGAVRAPIALDASFAGGLGDVDLTVNVL